MSGFSFPPPPPPPAKTTQPQQPFNSNRGQPHGRGSSRGGRGRQAMAETWRRNQYPSNVSKQAESTHPQSPIMSEGQHNPSATAYTQHRGPNNFQNGLSDQVVPSGLFLNPNFGIPQYGFSHHRNAPANLPSGFGNRHSVQSQDVQNQSSPPRTMAGHKRKLEALRGPDRQKKPAPPTAPAIPSFGAALLPPKPADHGNVTQTKQNSPAQAKSSRRSLGLVPRSEDAQYSSSESEDEGDLDEESAHAELGNKLTFEHNGVIMSLNSQADLADWKKERKRNWPTSRRLAEKYEERKKTGEERKRLLESASVLRRSSRRLDTKSQGFSKTKDHAEDPSISNSKPETELEKAKREVTEQSKRLEDLRRKVAESEAKNRAARAEKELAEAQSIDEAKVGNEPVGVESDLGGQDLDEMGETFEDGEEAEKGQQSPDDNRLDEPSSGPSSDSSSSLDSDEESPEEVTSKPVEAKKSSDGAMVCRYFAASGRCRDGDACRFRHEQSSNATHSQSVYPKPQTRNPSFQSTKSDRTVQRKGIYEILLEQEREKEDRLALKVIKHLGSVGFFKEGASLEAT